MSDKRQETIADIVAEMRIGDLCAEDTSASRPEYINDFLVSYAGRIEAAWEREIKATTEKSSAVGTVREVAQEMLNTSMQEITAERINGWATRLAEACEQSVTDCNQLNNAAAMRKALVQVSRIAVEMTRKTITGESEDRKTVDRWALRLCDIACDGISAPPRNCDVGTAEEQYARVRAFCERHKEDCPENDVLQKNCALIWAQMPYEEGGAK